MVGVSPSLYGFMFESIVPEKKLFWSITCIHITKGDFRISSALGYEYFEDT